MNETIWQNPLTNTIKMYQVISLFAQFSFVLPVLQLWFCTFLYYIIKCTAKPIEFHPISIFYLFIVIEIVLNIIFPIILYKCIPIVALFLCYKDIFHYETIVLYQWYMQLLFYLQNIHFHVKNPASNFLKYPWKDIYFYEAFPQTNCKSDSGNVKLQKNDSQSF